MAAQDRIQAAKAYVAALSTGDRAAAQTAAPHLAQNVTSQLGQRTFEGHDEVLKRITGNWPLTPVYKKGVWGDPRAEEDTVKVGGQMSPVGAGPQAVNLTFWFDASDKINKVLQENLTSLPLHEGDKLPQFAKERINNALANDT